MKLVKKTAGREGTHPAVKDSSKGHESLNSY